MTAADYLKVWQTANANSYMVAQSNYPPGYITWQNGDTITLSMDMVNSTVGAPMALNATVDGLALFIATELEEELSDVHFELADRILEKYGTQNF